MTARLAPSILPAAILAGAILLSGCMDRAEAGLAASANQASANTALPTEPITDARPRSYLLSITGIALGPNEYVDGFSIDSWGVDFLSVCHLPPGWRITAGRSAAPDGIIAGEASHGVTWLNQPALRQLEGLALVRIYDRVQPAEIRSGETSHPATFDGHASIETYGINGGRPGRRARLTAANIRLAPAMRCPVP